MKDGQGVFNWPDGKKYDGQWKAGKQHGLGYYTSKSGETRRGRWVDGKRTEWLD